MLDDILCSVWIFGGVEISEETRGGVEIASRFWALLIGVDV